MKPFIVLLFLSVLISCSEDNIDPVVVIAPQLKSMTTYIQNQSGQFRPGEKIEYEYSALGQLIKDTQWQYETMDNSFFLFSTSTYSYSGSKLITINKSYTDQPNKVITTYEYSNDQVSKIKEDNGIDTEASIKYLADNRIEVTYNHSNGRWFIYRFTLDSRNKNFEEVVGDDQLVSSKTTHEYDSGKNPLTLLGYTDMFFNSASMNNKIKTESNYIKAPYPQSTPISYSYVYNEWGYPAEQITTYRSTGESAAISRVKIVYEYQ